ncbi:hypothetical protein LMG28688_00930 [Paraburkholderia caffeinitolerans]|uniref:Uncharacterized protein n=1 Tax=Paraburkholderia caffeinitolerans TaxID=1723730 RepID=A0A6J5FKR1_9BURK|nr:MULTISPECIES: hypothetical protein [Paraburkholderia]CAB3779808.1 hypothetical protein LMG28688_00930 [Paraburkholderia caffeinitolerans]
MDILLSDQGFAIPLAILCTAVVLLAPFLEVPPRRAIARRRSYAVAAIMLGSPFLMVGLIYLVVRFVFD